MIERVRRKYAEFIAYGDGKQHPLYFVYYLYLMRVYYTRPAEFFENRLYRIFEDHSNYFHTTTQYRRSWKVKKLEYLPDVSPVCSLGCFLDFSFARILYPGLDAMDYFAYEFMNFRHAKRKTFITNGGLAKMDRQFNSNLNSQQNAEARAILLNKDRFNLVFADLVGRKWLKCGAETSFEEFLLFCDGLEAVIIKPVDGFGGTGLRKAFVRTPEDRKKLYDEVRNKNFLLEEVVVQHPQLSYLNPSSVNTIRVYTVESKGRIEVTGATLRIGRAGSVTDNYSDGGLAAEIDAETGTVVSRAIDKYSNAYYIHPDSSKAIIGCQIPHWEEILATVIAAHHKISSLRYIGWDVCISAAGKVVLIEANTGAGVGLQQHPSLTGKKFVYQRYL